eukprot:scaffold80190_cov57-Phaeocystis_antarctica.AAC.2
MLSVRTLPAAWVRLCYLEITQHGGTVRLAVLGERPASRADRPLPSFLPRDRLPRAHTGSTSLRRAPRPPLPARVAARAAARAVMRAVAVSFAYASSCYQAMRT